MKTAIVAFLMSAVVATATAWIKDKIAFPMTAADQIKALAADADSSTLAMNVLAGNADKMTGQGLQTCLMENQGAADPCMAKAVSFLKDAVARRAEITKASAETQSAADGLMNSIRSAPFSGSITAQLESLQQRLGRAKDSLAAATAESDFSLAQLANHLATMKGSEAAHQAAVEQLAALKANGLGSSLERAQMLAELAAGKRPH